MHLRRPGVRFHVGERMENRVIVDTMLHVSMSSACLWTAYDVGICKWKVHTLQVPHSSSAESLHRHLLARGNPRRSMIQEGLTSKDMGVYQNGRVSCGMIGFLLVSLYIPTTRDVHRFEKLAYAQEAHQAPTLQVHSSQRIRAETVAAPSSLIGT